MAHTATQNQTGPVAPSKVGRLPDFIIIGAMKAGTTSLFDVLSRHPDVFLCPEKEPMFFSRDPVYAKGFDWYRSLFAAAREDQLVGEASTCYSRYPHFGDAVGRLHAAIPDAKLIYIMRHPVERAYSHYGHEMRFEVTMTFDEALRRDRSIIDASLYVMQIEQYLRLFPRERMLLLTLDDYQADPAAVLAQVQDFLGLRRVDLTAEGKLKANAAGSKTVRKRLGHRLKSFRQWPVVRQIADRCPSGVRQGLYRFLLDRSADSRLGRRIADEHRAQLSPMTPETRARLLQTFEAPTRELEKLLGRELPGWFE